MNERMLSFMQDFKKLRVWHLARELSVFVIRAFPERTARRAPGLRGQAIRSAMSVAANLAEGCGRPTRPEFLHFADVSLASLNELEAHLLIARDAVVIAPQRHLQIQLQVDLTRRMLISLSRTLQRRIAEDELARLNARSGSNA